MLRVKELRKEKHMTQADLASSIGKTQVSVCRWETGKGTPSLATLSRIASVLGCTLDELVAEERKEEGT